MGWKKKIQKARELHRPELKDWECDEIYKHFPVYVDNLSDKTNQNWMNYSTTHIKRNYQLPTHNRNPKYSFGICKKKSSSDDNTIEEYHFVFDHPCQISHPENQLRCFRIPSTSTRNHHQHPSADTSRIDRQEEEKKESTWNDNHQLDMFDYVPAILDAKTLTTEEFWYQYENPCIPCIIQNIPYGYDNGQNTNKPWPALTKWDLPTLLQYNNTNTRNKTKKKSKNDIYNHDDDDGNNHSKSNKENTSDHGVPQNQQAKDQCNEDEYYFQKLRNRKFKCGEDDDGNSIKIRLKYFLHYMIKNYDDSPLYIFDSSFERDKYSKSLLDDYTVPSYFAKDLFTGLISEQRRPPYRWILFGPKRSGSTVHIDPLATNAWNTLLQGRKRWVLFPPYIAKHIVKGKGLIDEKEDDEAVHYFMHILPKIRQNAISQFNESKRNNHKNHNNNHNNNGDNDTYYNFHDPMKPFVCYEFTQNPGETVFVPNGWWHAVLNLENTVGVTQNYVSERNFRNVWIETRSGRKRMAWKWLQNLKHYYPHLYQQAIYLNEKDHFIMKYDPIHYERIQHAKKLRESQKQHKHKNDRKSDESDCDRDDDDDDGSSDGDKEPSRERGDKEKQLLERRKKMRLVV